MDQLRRDNIKKYSEQLFETGHPDRITQLSGALNSETNLALTEAIEKLQLQIPQSTVDLKTGLDQAHIK